MDTKKGNWNSSELTDGWQIGVRSFYWGLGFKKEDFSKPQIGIGVPLLEGNLCNTHAYQLATHLETGCKKAGLHGFKFGVPGVSDNITQGHEGGNASLVSRNVIANAAEMVVSSHRYDGLIGMHHCDKNGPGFAMALARLNYPGLLISGGSIKPGCHEGKPITILDPYEAQARLSVGEIADEEAMEIVKKACPGPGGCGIAASFNTWGIAMEAIGLMVPYSSSIPAESPDKQKEMESVGDCMKVILEEGITPRDILTKKAFTNATTAIAAAGGSTNGILHILALAREAQVDFTLKDIQEILRRTPVMCQFAPRGKGTMVDLHHLGGTPMLLKHFLNCDLLDGNCLTVTGKTLKENLEAAPDFPNEQNLIAPENAPFRDYADMQICFGNIAPEGIVFKVSSIKDGQFTGKAMCFTDPKAIVDAVSDGKIKPGTVVVLREMGPVACGMPEVLVATSSLAVPELYGKVALVSDTRVSGVSHGAIGIHCSPESVVGGPIGFIKEGDPINIDLLNGKIHCDVDPQVWEKRSQEKLSQLKKVKYQRGYLADFCSTVTQASDGCVPRWVKESI